MSRSLLIGAALLLMAPSGWGHGSGVSGTHVLDWHNETVSRVVSPGFSWNNLGVTAIAMPGAGVRLGERDCMRAPVLDVDVRDSFAFDLDEPVTVTLMVDAATVEGGMVLAYDRAGGPGIATPASELTRAGELAELTFTLPRARFLNRGDHGTDLMLTARAVLDPGALTDPNALPPQITVCDIAVERSFQTAAPVGFGWLDLSLTGSDGRPVSARVGLYDETGILPPPSETAVPIRKFDDRTRTFLLQANAVWPHDNRFVFYVDGGYRARLPAGTYRLVATKGIEYRMLDEMLEVRPGAATRRTFTLPRYTDLPSEGWLSGDVHVHNLRREAGDSRTLIAQTSAEDVHVANILRMGNVAGTYFPQPGYGPDHHVMKGAYTLVAGQEDPRTLTLGHTIHLDIASPVRFDEDYLDYQRVFEAVAEQGGLSGFAHAAGGLSGTREGMTMQATTGLLDFGEVMQGGQIGTDVWFALLNLGYRMTPAAGTDYPYIDHPGAVRTYVRTEGRPDAEAWFEGLARGQAFVTNGPLLSFTANGQTMGSELRIGSGDTVRFAVSSRLNPDLGTPGKLELIRFGEVIASSTAADGDRLTLDHTEPVTKSGWYVTRATATSEAGIPLSAMSAPVYVLVDGDARSWRRDAVGEITTVLIQALEAVKNTSPDSVIESEAWHSMSVWATEFSRQLAAVRPRIEAAQTALRDLAEEARR